jgi:hypothetical protein
MNSLLLFFKEDVLEMWSLDPNSRLLPVNYNSSNKIPLNFLLSGDQILMDSFAKKSYNENVVNSFGDFWQNNASNILEYERFGSKYKFDTLLPYTLKESILPSVVKSHFHCGNLSDFLTQFNTLVAFDSFIEQEQQEKVQKNFLEIVGFNPRSLILIDFWEKRKEVLVHKNIITKDDSLVFVNGSVGNIYFHLIGKDTPSHVSKKVLTGKGHDPRIDTILDFLSEIARAKNSIVPQADIKKEILSDAEFILNKLSDGYVMHTIKNDKIGINPLKIGFHRSEIDGRLNNKQSLNFIQNEFDSFRRMNNAENLVIVLSGNVINQPVFIDFFTSTYPRVHSESVSSETEFILRCLEQNRKYSSEALANPVVATPPFIKTPPVVNTPPTVNTPPKVTLPPVVKVPPVPTMNYIATTEHKPVVKVPPIIKPEVKVPPIIKEVQKEDIPLPPALKGKFPPPPPPPPPTKKK